MSDGIPISDISAALTELDRASSLYPNFSSAHEGYAVLLEEFDELWNAIKLNQKTRPERAGRIREEAIHVAAMSLKFLRDCTEEM
jgi:hypothetical protein